MNDSALYPGARTGAMTGAMTATMNGGMPLFSWGLADDYPGEQA